MNAASYIGAKLYYLGYRMQPLRIRRGISLIMAIGMEWQKENEEILKRAMDGEHLELEVGFQTNEVDPAASSVAPSHSGDK